MRTTTILFGLIASAMLPCSSTKMKDVCIHRALEVSTRPGREAIASPTAPLETSLDVLACFLKFLNRGKYWHCALFAAFCRALPPALRPKSFPHHRFVSHFTTLVTRHLNEGPMDCLLSSDEPHCALQSLQSEQSVPTSQNARLPSVVSRA